MRDSVQPTTMKFHKEAVPRFLKTIGVLKSVAKLFTTVLKILNKIALNLDHYTRCL